MRSLTILHTSDLHNRLSAAQAELIGDLHRRLEHSLLLDAGDAIGAGNLGCRPGGEPILRLMTGAGYQAMAMGNRESHPTRAVLVRKLADAGFPVLAANLMAKRQPRPEQVRDSITLALPGGLRVAVFGLAPQITAPESWWSRVTDYVFDAPLKTAAGLAPKLRAEADLVVCLSHLGQARERELAALPEVDVVVGGHSHQEYGPQPGCLCVSAGHHGRCLGRLDLELGEPGEVHVRSWELIPLGRSS